MTVEQIRDPGEICSSHFRQYGTGVGLGKGQQLLTPAQYLDWFWKKNQVAYNQHYKKGITTEELANRLFKIYHDNPKQSGEALQTQRILRELGDEG